MRDIEAGGLQDEQTERLNEARGLRHRDKVGRFPHRTIGPPPADQRLEAAQLAGFRAQNRLIEQHEFLVRQAGHESRSARDGNEALAAIEAFRPHLVLLDLMLPQKSGLEVCFAIRANPELQNMKVLMLTAKGGANEVARGIAAGADDYVIKPFSTRELAERLRLLLAGMAT